MNLKKGTPAFGLLLGGAFSNTYDRLKKGKEKELFSCQGRIPAWEFE